MVQPIQQTQGKKGSTEQGSSSVLAREEDGTIQITVTIPSEDVKKAEEAVLAEAAQTTYTST